MTLATLIQLAILAVVVWIAIRQEVIRMATEAEFQAAFDRVNVATTAIATLLRDLRDQLSQDGLTATQEAAQIAKLGAAADALEAMAQSTTNPVPVEPPTA